MSKHNNLQGLNVIHPPLPQSDPELLSTPAFPDLAEQLELWTNLTFENDDNNSAEGRYCPPPSGDYDDLDDEDEASGIQAHHPAPHDAHVNVVTGTAVPNNQGSNLVPFGGAPNSLSLAQFLQGAAAAQHRQQPQPQHHQPHGTQGGNGDLMSMLASIGVDPFSQHAAAASSQHQAHQQQQQQHNSSLPPLPPPSTFAQLLALQNAQASSSAAASSSSSHPSTSSLSSSSASHDQVPATKRARSRKSSVSTTLTAEDDSTTTSNAVSTSPSASSPTAPSASPSTTPAAEDKRKRNTAASARFRQKKKEREAALEQKAKELESKVSELERECEGLRRENGWLKGLVIGVTGAAQSQQQQSVSAGVKRLREDETEVSPL